MIGSMRDHTGLRVRCPDDLRESSGLLNARPDSSGRGTGTAHAPTSPSSGSVTGPTDAKTSDGAGTILSAFVDSNAGTVP